MSDLAKSLRASAALLVAEAEKLEAQYGAPAVQQIHASGTNIFANTAAGPWDPNWPGYQPGDGWQVMLRRYARDDGYADCNKYVRDRGLTPRWPDAKQDWEPA